MKHFYLIIVCLLLSASVYSQMAGTIYGGNSTSASLLLDSLFAYYSLDDAAGDATDDHASYDLTLQNAPTRGVSGKINDCYSFLQSSAQYLDYTPTDFEFPGAFSLSWWFKTSTPSARAGMVSNFGIPSYGYDSKMETSGAIIIDFRHGGAPGNTQLTAASGLNLDDDAWHHMVVTFNTDTVKLYVDHVLIEANETNDDITWHVDCIFTVGTRGSSEWDGELDEVGIWRGIELTHVEVDALYNSGSGLAYPLDY